MQDNTTITTEESQIKAVIDKYISCSWWQLLLRGLLALFFGLYAIFRPGQMLFILVILNAAFWLVDGIFMFFASLAGTVAGVNRLWLAVRALIGIIAGIAVFTHPVISTLFLVWLTVLILAVLAMFSGVQEIILGAKRKNGWLIFGGIIYVIFSLIILHAPIMAAGPITRIIGIFVAIGGLSLSIFSLRLRTATKSQE